MSSDVVRSIMRINSHYLIDKDRISFGRWACDTCPMKKQWSHFLTSSKGFPKPCVDCKYYERMTFNCGKPAINKEINFYNHVVL